METIGSYEAKTHFSQLLDRVMRGEQIAISRNGMPVAVLQPVSASSKPNPSETIARIKMFREEHALDGLSIRNMIEEGRR